MKLLTALLSASLTLSLAAQDDAMPKPGPEHQKLALSEGTWDAAMEMVTPDGQAMHAKGVSVMKMGLGGFWLVDDFTADIMGTPFQGHGLTGYDPIKGKYVSTWADSMSPSMMVMEGGFDASGKVMTMTGMGVGPDGKPAKHRLVSTHKDKDTTVFEMFVHDPAGKEMKTMTITYTRRAAKSDHDGHEHHDGHGKK